MAVTDIIDLASKIDGESKYWQGYDPNLIAQLKTASLRLEKNIVLCSLPQKVIALVFGIT